MRAIDAVKQAQSNLVRSKLRTSLTVIAVFIGALTLSLTNGVGNGVRAYVDTQLGNVGVPYTLIVQAKQDQGTNISTEVTEYNPDQATGNFDVKLLGPADTKKIQELDGVTKVTPRYNLQPEYITTGEKKFNAQVQQDIAGLQLELAAGRLIDANKSDEVTIPIKLVEYLGFDSADAALGKTVTFGIKQPTGTIIEIQGTVVGVQQNSLLGNSSSYVSDNMAIKMNELATAGVPTLQNKYLGILAQYDSNLSTEQVDALKQHLTDLGYEAKTFEEQIGTVMQVIDALIMGLNLFGIIALLAASFGIINTLLMAVNERTREIGLMKALGSSRRSIFMIFSIEAMSLGFWGALIGILASIGIGRIINQVASDTFLKDFEGFNLMAFPLLPSLAILGIIVLIAFIAGALPSLKASRLDPIEALRYE